MEKGETGIYFLKDGDNVVYIGQSKTCVKSRIYAHQSAGVKKFDNFAFIPLDVDCVDDAEISMIQSYQPKYNVAKGGMNYVKRQDELPEDKRRKDIDIMMRVNAYEKELFKEAAQIDQRRLRDWMRVSLVRAAERLIKERQ